MVQGVLCIILMSFPPDVVLIFNGWLLELVVRRYFQLLIVSSAFIRCSPLPHGDTYRFPQRRIFTSSDRSTSRQSSSKSFSFSFATYTRTLSTPHRQYNRFQCINTRPSVHPFVCAVQLTFTASTPPVPSMRHLHAVNAPPIPPCNVQPKESLTVTFQRSTRQLHAG